MKLFQSLGSNVGNQLFSGAVVASADTIYMFQEIVVSADSGPTHVPGAGLAGVVIGAAIDINKARVAKKFTTGDAPILRFSQLPQNVTSHPDWPKTPRKDCNVVCFSKAHVTRIKKKWPNRFLITAAGIDYKVDYPPFTGGKRRDFLRDASWPIL